jgi:Tfp pilus assembly protein PilF
MTMKTRGILRVFVAVLVGVLVAGSVVAQEWTGRGRIQVLVKDADKNPVADAKIWLRLASNPEIRPDKDFTTNKKGKFNYLGLKGGSWILRVEAEGFEPWEELVEIYSQGMPETINVNLIPLPEEVLEAQAMAKLSAEYDRANDLMSAGDYEGARAVYRTVLEGVDADQQPPILVSIASTYMNEGRYDEAVEVLDQSLAIDPSHVDSLQNKCAIVASQGRIEEAEVLLAQIPPDASVHPTTLINIGMAHYNEGEITDAKPLLDRAIEHYPDTAAAYYYRGLVNLSLGDGPAAKADFERFVELDPASPQAAEAKEYLSYLTAEDSGQ